MFSKLFFCSQQVWQTTTIAPTASCYSLIPLRRSMSFLGVMSNGRHCQFGRGSDGQQANLGVYSGTLFSNKLDVFCVCACVYSDLEWWSLLDLSTFEVFNWTRSMLKLRFDENGSFKPQDGSTHFEATPWPMFNWMPFTLVNDSFACLDSPIPTPLLHSYVWWSQIGWSLNLNSCS